MELNKLSSIVRNKKRRLGQGHGSGRVKTSGRGTKGQNAKGKRPIYFEGGAVPLTKRIPFLRGKGRNKAFKKSVITVSLSNLNTLPKNSTVDHKTLMEHNIISKDSKNEIKVLGTGKLEIPLKVIISVSKSAQKAIEKAGGSVELTKNT